MPRRYRDVVEPVVLEGRSACEIAAELGRAPGTVRVQLRRGLQRLRRALPRDFASFGLALPLGFGAARRAMVRGPRGAPAGTAALTSSGAPLAVAPSACVASAVGAAALLVPLSLSPAPGAEEDHAMQPAHLILPLALGLSAPVPAQDEPRRAVVAEATVEQKLAALDGLVSELLHVADGEGTEAAAARAGLQGAVRRIEGERKRRVAEERRALLAGEDDAERWVADASQLVDGVRRATALDEIRAALDSGDPPREAAACGALARLGEVKFDKAPFRAPVHAIARRASGELRVRALEALHETVHYPEDLELALALADEPEPHPSASRVLHLFSGGDLTGRAGDAVERLFADEDRARLREVMRGLWGARVSPEIEARLLELSRDPRHSHDAIYFGLSTLKDKSRAVVERLIEVLGDPNPNDHGRALWGLGNGVRAEHGHLVAAAVRELFEARTQPGVQADAVRLVGRYGGADDAAWLEAIRGDSAIPDAVRADAERAAAGIARRAAAE